MAYKFFDKKIESGAGANVNEELTQELHKPVIKKFKRMKVCARFKENIWAGGLAEMGSLSSKNQGVCLRCFHQMCLGQTIERQKS